VRPQPIEHMSCGFSLLGFANQTLALNAGLAVAGIFAETFGLLQAAFSSPIKATYRAVVNNNLACPVPDDWSMLTTFGKF
jgi:hypothetical protein